jgi:glycerophosphoryl diester phosphodiesterase
MKHVLTTIVAVLLVGCSSFNHSVWVASFQMPTRGICAHRGVSDSHPENTIAAFREAIRLGTQMIELDVALSSDGKLVLMHDYTVDRTTDGSGRVEELMLADLKQLDAGSWKGSRFK